MVHQFVGQLMRELTQRFFRVGAASQFGAEEIPKASYERLLDEALSVKADFYAIDAA